MAPLGWNRTNDQRINTIGHHNDPYRVDQARAKAIEIKAQMWGGTDPIEAEAKQKEEKRQQAILNEARSATLRQVMEHYLIHRRTKHGPLRNATKKDIRRHCEVNLTKWLDLPMAATVARGGLSGALHGNVHAGSDAGQCVHGVPARAL
jgi:hypothetical protein